MRRSLIAGLVVAGLLPFTPAPATAAPGTTATPVAVGPAAAGSTSSTRVTARTLLGRLGLAAESHSSTYTRTTFKHWVDADGDSCDTREEVLITESRVAAKRGAGCKIVAGRWFSELDGLTWTNPSDVDIDHLVALKEAWESGAWAWTAAKRQRYANDLAYPLTLTAMTDNLNMSKGDRDPAQWLPPRSGARCGYAITWVQVKYRWSLKVDSAERSRLRTLISGSCGDRLVTVPAKGA